MSPIGHPAAIRSTTTEEQQRTDPAEQLPQYPEAQKGQGWNVEPRKVQHEEHEDPRSREHHHIGAHHCGNGSGSAYAGGGAVRVQHDPRSTGRQIPEEVEQKERAVVEHRFDVVREHPQEHHVAQEVHEAPVQEHATEERMQVNAPADLRGDAPEFRHVELGGRVRVLPDKAADVQYDERVADDGLEAALDVIVADRENHAARAQPVARHR